MGKNLKEISLWNLLNCFKSECNWINWKSCLVIFNRFSSVLALSLIDFKMVLISLVVAIMKTAAPVVNIVKQATKVNPYAINVYCIKTLIKYPSGFFQSNKNLKKDTFSLRMLSSKYYSALKSWQKRFINLTILEVVAQKHHIPHLY